MKKAKIAVKIILSVVWVLSMADFMFVAFIAGPAPDAGLIYLISAAAISILMPSAICAYIHYTRYLLKIINSHKDDKKAEDASFSKPTKLETK